jgi:hypothetical protein
MRRTLPGPSARLEEENKRMAHRSPKLRCSEQAVVAGLAFAAVLTAIISVPAEAKPSSSSTAPLEHRTDTAEESKRLGDEAQRRAEVRQHIWDRKMKAVGSSICTGC